MMEDAKVSFDIDENNDCDNDEMSTFQPTQSSLEIHCTAGSIPVAVAGQSHNSSRRMNSSFILSNNPEDLRLEAEECPAISKLPSPVYVKKGIMWNRKACGWSSFIFFVLLVGVISLGLVVWSNRKETVTRNSYHSTSEPHSNTLPTQATDIFCQNRSTIGFLSELFTSGYDIMRTNPLDKKVYRRPLLTHTLLQECRITQDAHRCQPNVESVLIDSLASFHQWTRRFIAFPHTEEEQQFNDSAIIGAVSSAHDNDLLNIQAGLMSGNLIIMTHLNCPLVNTSRTHAPQIKPEYLQRLRMTTNANMDDEEELKELIEDFGAHYVDQVVLGTEVIIRFTLDRKAIDLFKRQNLSLVSHATATGLYVLSRTYAFINSSKNNQKLATEFIASVNMQIYSGSTFSPPISQLQTADYWVQLALKHFVVISVQVKQIDYLFAQIPQNNIPTIHEKWWQSRKQICSQILSLELTGKCEINSNKNSSKSLVPQHKNEQHSAFVLPLLLIWTNRSTVCLRTSWKHCLELCRNDPLCSAATICVTSRTSTYQISEGTTPTSACPSEFKTCDCALHRQQDFSYGIISPKVVTLVPVRQDLRPVILRGFAVYGKPLNLIKQLPDLASCVRICSRTVECKIVSFSQYDLGQNKICKLFSNMTDNELRRNGQATTLFEMATFNPCFSNDKELERNSCPANANCSSVYGMCVCMLSFFKNGSTCTYHNVHYRQNTTKWNEIADSNSLEKISQHSVYSTDGQHRNHPFSSTISRQTNTSIPPKIFEPSIASSGPIPTALNDGLHITSEPEIPNNLRHMSNIETISSSESIHSTSMNSKHSKDKLSSIDHKSSYVPWQMKFWNRAAL